MTEFVDALSHTHRLRSVARPKNSDRNIRVIAVGLLYFTQGRARMLLHSAFAVSECHYNGALERFEVFAEKAINCQFLCCFDVISMLELAVKNL